MTKLLAILVVLPMAQVSMCSAQAGPPHANVWQLAVAPPVVEPTDEASKRFLSARGAIFDKFSPASETGDSETPNAAGVIYSPGSVGRRPELPIRESDAIVVGKFSKHFVHLSPSGKSVYTEIIFTPKEIIKASPGNLQVGIPFSILESGGAVRTSEGKVLRSPVTLKEFSLIPDHSYVLFLRYNPASNSYETVKSWDVTNGIAVPNSSEDAQLARENRSTHSRFSTEALVAEIRSKLNSR